MKTICFQYLCVTLRRVNDIIYNYSMRISTLVLAASISLTPALLQNVGAKKKSKKLNLSALKTDSVPSDYKKVISGGG